MFEEPSHDGTNLDIFAESRNSRTQTAYSAHKEPYSDSRSRSLEKLTHYIRIGERIHLCKYSRRLTCPRFLLFGAYEIGECKSQGVGSHYQLLHDRSAEIARNGIEENRRVLAELTVGCQKRIVCVYTRRHIVVIARAEVEITLDAVCLAAYYQGYLGMCL